MGFVLLCCDPDGFRNLPVYLLQHSMGQRTRSHLLWLDWALISPQTTQMGLCIGWMMTSPWRHVLLSTVECIGWWKDVALIYRAQLLGAVFRMFIRLSISFACCSSTSPIRMLPWIFIIYLLGNNASSQNVGCYEILWILWMAARLLYSMTHLIKAQRCAQFLM